MPAATGGITSNRRRVVFALDTFEIGGTELNAVRTAERLDRARFEVQFVCLAARGPLLERALDGGFPVTEFSIGSLVGVRALREGFRFRRWLRRERIAIVHAHDIYTNIWAVPWARLAGVPLVIASRRWWVETNRAAHIRLNHWSYLLAHKVLANSPAVAGLLRAEGIAPSRVLTVPNFVDDVAFAPPPPDFVDHLRAELAIAPGDEVLGIIANLHGIKDIATMIRAMARLAPARPRLRLVLVGDGAERKALEMQCDELGLSERVIFAGRRPSQPSCHWLFDVSVLCSRGEGFPNAIVEAMAAQRPVVATRVGGIPDAVVDAETGLLVDPGDEEALASAVARLLDDDATRGRMGLAGAARARALFSDAAVIRSLESVYDETPSSR